MDDAHAGKFSMLIVWALDRTVRDDEGGGEAALRVSASADSRSSVSRSPGLTGRRRCWAS
jgi:hypothetical protein